MVSVEAVPSYAELIREIAPCRASRGHRYHNVMCALKLCKPTISLGYSRKFIDLMADMGLADFNQFAYSLDLGSADRAVQGDREPSRGTAAAMAERNAANRESLDHQFAVLSALALPGARPHPRNASAEPDRMSSPAEVDTPR